jgi:hypothetical protein
MRLKTLLVPALLVAVFAVPLLIKAGDERARVAAEREAVRARHEKAEAMFQERCKKAGEFIYRTAEDVEGVFLLKIREKNDRYAQYKMDDPYGHDSTGEYYLKSFFYGRDKKGSFIVDGPVASEGYRYVDAINQKDGQRYRYTGRIDQPWLRDKRYGEWVRDFVLDKTLAPDPTPRYGVTYDDISTREERDYWIAGSSLKVIDLETSEVMAERIGYMMDRGQGNKSGGRAPWLMAARTACPRFSVDPGGQTHQIDQTRKFVEKVLHPIQEK